MIKMIKCEYCGREIVRQNRLQKYCQPPYKCHYYSFAYGDKIPFEQRAARTMPGKSAEAEKPEPIKAKPKSELARINEAARAAGMSYGKYVSKYGL